MEKPLICQSLTNTLGKISKNIITTNVKISIQHDMEYYFLIKRKNIVCTKLLQQT